MDDLIKSISSGDVATALVVGFFGAILSLDKILSGFRGKKPKESGVCKYQTGLMEQIHKKAVDADRHATKSIEATHAMSTASASMAKTMERVDERTEKHLDELRMNVQSIREACQRIESRLS